MTDEGRPADGSAALDPAPPPPPPPPSPGFERSPQPPAPAAAPAQGVPPAVSAAGDAARHAASQAAAKTRVVLAGLDPTGWRGTIAVAAVLVALVLGTQLLNAVLPARAESSDHGQGGPAAPVSAGGAVEVVPGVSVYPRPGWTARSTETGLRLQKGSRTVDVRVDPSFAGSPIQLHQAYVANVLQPQAGGTTSAPQATQLVVSDPTVRSLGGRRAAVGTYSGIFQGVPGTLEGELIAIVTAGGQGVVFDAYAPEGSLRAGIDDIESMASTVEAR